MHHINTRHLCYCHGVLVLYHLNYYGLGLHYCWLVSGLISNQRIAWFLYVQSTVVFFNLDFNMTFFKMFVKVKESKISPSDIKRHCLLLCFQHLRGNLSRIHLLQEYKCTEVSLKPETGFSTWVKTLQRLCVIILNVKRMSSNWHFWGVYEEY